MVPPPGVRIPSSEGSVPVDPLARFTHPDSSLVSVPNRAAQDGTLGDLADNCQCGRTPRTQAHTSKLNRMEQQITTLLRERSRTPLRAQQSQPTSPAPYQQIKGKGKGAKGSGKKGKGKCKATSQPAEGHLRSFHEFRQLGARAKAAYHTNAASKIGVCWNFQSRMPCPVTPCPRHHTCIGCGKANVPLRRLPLPRERPLSDRLHGHEQKSGRGLSFKCAFGVCPFTFHACQGRGFSCHCRHPSFFCRQLPSLPVPLQ